MAKNQLDFMPNINIKFKYKNKSKFKHLTPMKDIIVNKLKERLITIYKYSNIQFKSSLILK